MTNLDVVDAKTLHHLGEIDESLKKGIEVLVSDITLTSIDSFNTYQIIAYNLNVLDYNTIALEYAEKAIKTVNRAFTEDKRFENSKWIASYYFNIGLYKKAIEIKKQELLLENDTLSLLKIYNDIGVNFHKDYQLDSAIYYYKKVINHKSDNEEIKEIIALATGNIGGVYFDKKEYKSALKYLKQDVEISKKSNKISYNALYAIGKCYYYLGDYSKTIKALEAFKGLTKKERELIYTKVLLNTYQLFMDTYAKQNDIDKSIVFMHRYFNLKDSISQYNITYEELYREISNNKINSIKKDLEITNAKLELNETKKQRMTISITLLIILLILIGVVILAYINKQRKNNEIQRLNTEVIALELDHKKKDLNNVASNLSFIRKFIDDSLEKIKNIQKATAENIKSEIVSLSHDFNRFKNSDENLAVLQSDFEKTNSEFFSKLEIQFPDLTQNERELCGMLLLKLSTKDIASFRNVTPNAIKKARQRLRKKLPLTEKESVTKFLENLR